jgi:hypothetical protein
MSNIIDKIEFSDLYKFLTSVGLIFIISSIIMPWLFMNQDVGLLFSDLDYDALTERAKALVDRRTSINLKILKLLPYLSSFLFISGGAILIYGLKRWSLKQKFVDETDQIQLNVLRSKSLNPEQTEKKREDEINQDIKASKEDDSLEFSIKPKKFPSKEIEILKTNLVGIEELFFKKIADYNIFKYEPNYNVSIHDKYELDVVLKPINRKKYTDIYIEIKYLQQSLFVNIFRDVFSKMVKITGISYRLTNRFPKAFIMVVYKDNIASLGEINRFKIAISEYIQQFRTPHIKYYIMSNSEAEKFDISIILKNN